MGRVQFGLSNVHYATFTEAAGVITYATPVPLPGAVKLSLEAKGDTSTFYADNVAFDESTANNGYEGEAEMASVAAAALQALIGQQVGGNGVVYEATDQKAVPFALLYEIDGNTLQVRFALYNCKLTRPGQDANTTSDSKTPDTVKLKFSAKPLAMVVGTATKNIVKGYIENSEANATVYNGWNTAVVMPTAAG